MERCIVPMKIQIFVFFIVAVLLYFVYVYVEDNSFSPFLALLDSPNPVSDSEEGLQAETQHAPELLGQEEL